MRRAPIVLALALAATSCSSSPEEVELSRRRAERKKRDEEADRRAEREKKLDERAREISDRFGLEPLAARQLAGRTDLPDIMEEPYPSTWDRIAEALPVTRGYELPRREDSKSWPLLAPEDVGPLLELGKLAPADRDERIKKLLSPETTAFAKRLAEVYGYELRLADMSALVALAGTPAAARVTSPQAIAAWTAYLPARSPSWRLPLAALGPIERLSPCKPDAIAQARAKLVTAGVDPVCNFVIDPRVIELAAAGAADPAVVRAVEELNKTELARRASILGAPPASLSRLGKLDSKALANGLADLAHARGFARVEALDASVLDGAAALIEADATSLVLAIEMPFDAVVRPSQAARVVALRKKVTALQARELMRRAHRAGWSPSETVPDDVLVGAESILAHPGLAAVLEGARGAWPELRPRTPVLAAFVPLATRPAPEELLRVAASAGVDIARDPPGFASALAELDEAPQGRPVLVALVATFPDVRLSRAQDIRRLAALVKKGLAANAVLSLDKKVSLQGSLDDALAASLARAAGI